MAVIVIDDDPMGAQTLRDILLLFKLKHLERLEAPRRSTAGGLTV